MAKGYRRNRSSDETMEELAGSGKPSKKQMEQMFKEIVKFAKQEGCPVTVHKNLKKVNGSNGYFCYLIIFF